MFVHSLFNVPVPLCAALFAHCAHASLIDIAHILAHLCPFKQICLFSVRVRTGRILGLDDGRWPKRNKRLERPWKGWVGWLVGWLVGSLVGWLVE